MPFIVHYTGFRKYTSPEQAKLQLARYWRQHNKVRDPTIIDCFVAKGGERLYNIQNGDIWSGNILDLIAPVRNGTVVGNEGFSTLDDKKYEKKSDFLKDFYTGAKRVQY